MILEPDRHPQCRRVAQTVGSSKARSKFAVFDQPRRKQSFCGVGAFGESGLILTAFDIEACREERRLPGKSVTKCGTIGSQRATNLKLDERCPRYRCRGLAMIWREIGLELDCYGTGFACFNRKKYRQRRFSWLKMFIKQNSLNCQG